LRAAEQARLRAQAPHRRHELALQPPARGSKFSMWGEPDSSFHSFYLKVLPGRHPPERAVKRPPHPCESTAQNRFAELESTAQHRFAKREMLRPPKRPGRARTAWTPAGAARRVRPAGSGSACRGTWARVTIDPVRHLALQTCFGHSGSMNILANQMLKYRRPKRLPSAVRSGACSSTLCRT
jgi:hypothetical protein